MQILVQGAVAGKFASAYAKKADIPEPDVNQLKRIQSLLTRPFSQVDDSSAMELKNRIRTIADKNL